MKVEPQVLVPQIDVRLRPDALARAGLGAADVQRLLRTVLQGSRVGEVAVGGMLREVVVVGDPRLRTDVAALKNLVVVSPGGAEARLGDLADIHIVGAPNVVQHERGARRIDVSCDAVGHDLGAVARQVEARIASLPMAPGHHAEVLGEYAARSEARGRLVLLAGVALLGILLVLHIEFQTVRLTLLVFATLPLALVGGVVAVLVTGGVVSLGSLVGFVTVLGIAARNGVMLVSHFLHLERQEGVPFGVELVLRGVQERLTPIAMTALATGLALVPLVVGGSRPGQEIEQPMAVVILGGLVSSTLLNVFAVPCAYLLMGGERRA